MSPSTACGGQSLNKEVRCGREGETLRSGRKRQSTFIYVRTGHLVVSYDVHEKNPCVYVSRLICRSVAKLTAVVVWTTKTTLEQSQKWLILTASKTTLAGNRKRKQQFLSTIAKKNSSTIAKTVISVLKIHARNIFSDLTLFSYIIAQLYPLIVRI